MTMRLKFLLSCLLSALLCLSSAPSWGLECESIQDHAENTDRLYRKGCGAIDGAYTATSTSMLGWGIALFIAIGVIAGVIHQSKGKRIGSSSSSTTSTSS